MWSKVAISLLAVASAAAQPPSENSQAMRLPIDALLPNYISEDPTRDWAESISLSDAQVEFMRACYAEYRKEAMSLAHGIQQTIKDDGDYDERIRLADAASLELRLASRRSIERAMRDKRAAYLNLESQFFNGVRSVIAEGQREAFDQASTTLHRQSWLQRVRGHRQDFMQFGDPLPIIERHAVELSGDMRLALDELLSNARRDLSLVLPNLCIEYHDARQASYLAMIGGQRDEMSAASRRVARDWLRIYGRLDSVSTAAAGIFESQGRHNAARAIRESFWQGSFSDLVHFELSSALFAAFLDSPANEIDAEVNQQVSSLREAYLARRHALLKSAVAAHLTDFKTIHDAETRQDRLAAFLGCSSAAVTQMQLERCRLSQRARIDLENIVGPAAALDNTVAVQSARKAASDADQVFLDTPSVERQLEQRLERLHAQHSTGEQP